MRDAQAPGRPPRGDADSPAGGFSGRERRLTAPEAVHEGRLTARQAAMGALATVSCPVDEIGCREERLEALEGRLGGTRGRGRGRQEVPT